MRETAATIKGRYSRAGIGLHPREGTVTAAIWDRLFSSPGRPVALHDITTHHLDRRLDYLRDMYLLDIRGTGCTARGRGKGKGPGYGRYILAGVIDGKTYVDLVVNPHLAKTFLPPPQEGETPP